MYYLQQCLRWRYPHGNYLLNLKSVGSFVGNPFDVLKTLSQANKGKSAPLASLVGEMYQNQGIGGFYRGVEVNVMRACILNATKMGVYDLTKGVRSVFQSHQDIGRGDFR